MDIDEAPGLPATPTPPPMGPCTPVYEVRVTEHLGARWATWFAGFHLAEEHDGTTVLRGPVVDQAALHGVLQQLRDLGITLLSVTQLAPDAAPEHPEPHHQHQHQHQHQHRPGATS